MAWAAVAAAGRLRLTVRRASSAAATALRRYSKLTLAAEARIAAVEARHAALQAAVVQQATGSSFAALAETQRELAGVAGVVEAAAQRRRLIAAAVEWEAVARDDEEESDVRQLAEDEARAAAEAVSACESQLLSLLIPPDDDDRRAAVVEVRAGTGGDEAALFAMDLLRMYQQYCERRGWKWELLELTDTDLGGCKEATAGVSARQSSAASPGPYGLLRLESGVHRVQRVPATETSGRVHTSAASVVVLPEPDQAQACDIRDEDLRIDVYRASGAGGQHVNTTNSAVRVTHLPTGLVVAIQDERSQHKNKAKALRVLQARLYDAEQRKREKTRQEARSSLLVSGDRSERIRTYNFPQGRVTDHRVNLTVHGIDEVLTGDRLDEVIDALRQQRQQDALASVLGQAA